VRASEGANCFVSLDGTDCPIQEPILFNSMWYSHKINAAGLRYEIGLNIKAGTIVWVNGGVPCGTWSDLKLARSAYTSAIVRGEMTIADDGYGDSNYFIHPKQFPRSSVQQKKIMARHETINRRLKQFSILTVPFRHELNKHPTCFHAVANITQMMIMNGEPLYEIKFG
jgi:hypothetical protein